MSENYFSWIIPVNIYKTYLPAYENGTEGSETSAYKIQTPGNHPKQIIQQTLQVFLVENLQKFSGIHSYFSKILGSKTKWIVTCRM